MLDALLNIYLVLLHARKMSNVRLQFLQIQPHSAEQTKNKIANTSGLHSTNNKRPACNTALAAACLALEFWSVRRLAIGLGLTSSEGLSLADGHLLPSAGTAMPHEDLSAAMRRMKEGFRSSSARVPPPFAVLSA